MLYENEQFGDDSFTKKNSLFTATLDLYEGQEEVALMNVRRKEGDRVVKRIELKGKLRELVRSKYKNMNIDDICFIADIEFKNIRIAAYEEWEGC